MHKDTATLSELQYGCPIRVGNEVPLQLQTLSQLVDLINVVVFSMVINNVQANSVSVSILLGQYKQTMHRTTYEINGPTTVQTNTRAQFMRNYF
jgi:hypothetical protein